MKYKKSFWEENRTIILTITFLVFLLVLGFSFVIQQRSDPNSFYNIAKTFCESHGYDWNMSYQTVCRKIENDTLLSRNMSIADNGKAYWIGGEY